MRFIHTADWQLGMTRHFLNDEDQARYTAARIDAISTIGEIARRELCEFVVVCGDVFESHSVPPRVIRRSLAAMADVGLPVILLPGNHDPYDAAAIYRQREFVENKPANVIVLTPEKPDFSQENFHLHGAPWTSKRPLKDLVGEAIDRVVSAEVAISGSNDRAASQPFHIVVGHGAVEGFLAPAESPANISLVKAEQALTQGVIDYVALGDRHSATSVGSTGRMWYSGSQEPTSFEEDNPGKVLLVELTAQASAGDTRRKVVADIQQVDVSQWAFHDISREVNSSSELDELIAQLNSLSNKDRAVVRLAVQGTLTMEQFARYEELLKRESELFGALHVWERRTDIRLYEDDSAFSHLALGGYAQRAVADLLELAHGESDQAAAATTALSQLYRMTQGR